MNSKTFFSVLAGLLLVIISVHAAQAQNSDYESEEIQESSPVISPINDEYIPITLESLSKLYWVIGKLDLTDDEAIDNYMIINECELYTQFYHDDIEWKKLHDATREYISQNMSTFHTRFELLVPIALDRYNVEEKKFFLMPDSQIINTRRLDIRAEGLFGSDLTRSLCLKKNATVDKYSDSIILVLNQPFTFTEFEVDPELADLYLKEARSYYENLPPRLQIARYERIAYLRVKYRITTYKTEARDTSGGLRPLVLGQVEGYEVYADSKKYKLLFKKEIKDRRRLRRRKRISPVKPAEPPAEHQQKVDFSE